MSDLLSESVLGSDRSRLDIEFDWREGLEKAFHHLHINGICGNILADRDTLLLAQSVAVIACPVFVFHDHFVAARSAVDDALQQACSISRYATRFVAIIGGVVVG